MTRRSFLATAAALGAQPAGKPNIVVILADDLGSGDVSCYGAKDVRTPNIDSIAKNGVRFTSFYSNSPVCSPTRAALLTGRSPDLVGVPGVIRTMPGNSWGLLAADAVLLPRKLGEAGYHTCITGKWHLGLRPEDNPVRRAFHQFRGFLGDMMDDYYDHRRHGNNYMRFDEREVDPKGHATDLFTEWAVEYVKQPRREPFFLYLAYNAPHTPVQPTPESLDRVRKRTPGMTEKRAKIVALIEHMDEGVGKVLSALPENTLVIFTSDNGGHAESGGTNGPLRGAKQDMYEGGIRVPFCAMWKGRIQAGTENASVLQSSDIYGTVCAAAGLGGASFFDTPPPAGRTIFFVRREGGRPYYGQDYYAVRRGDWKLLHNTPFLPLELYNLKSDPQEKNNLIESQPKIAAELTRALQEHILQAGKIPWIPK
jgi:arylsulfatase A-like enzyme